MSQICSCNFEDTVKVGAKVNKGDLMGYFLFGGSDIVMLFQSDVNVEILCQKRMKVRVISISSWESHTSSCLRNSKWALNGEDFRTLLRALGPLFCVRKFS